MIVYVDLEHDWLKENMPDKWEKSMARRLKTKYQLEEISDDLCLIVHHLRVTPSLLHELNVHAIVISHCHTDFEHYNDENLAGLRAVYQEAAWPTMGICAGFQLMAQAYGAQIGPIGPLPPDTPDPYEGGYEPNVKQERGYMPVHVHTPHPLLNGLPQQPTFFQDHYWEVKSQPDGFQILAESDLCNVQAIAHTELPLFGVQFHVERCDEVQPDGRRVLENFFKIVNDAK